LKRNAGFFRTLFYLPTITGAGVALAVMWKALLSSEGLFNVLLNAIGLPSVPWLSDPNMAFNSLVMTSLYSFGGIMIIFLAGLKNIPESLYESATIDGAGSFKKLTFITIPMLSPVIFFNVIMGIINGFQTFTNGYIITLGGPLKATLFFMINLYRQAFEYHHAGYASALAWALFVIILFFTLIVFRTSDVWVYYEASVKKVKRKR
jgi:multiple sugar transport system permease protein